MKNNAQDKITELMCAAMDIKEQMRSLYGQAAGKCSDEVGTGTFKMLEQMESEHIDRLKNLSEQMKQGGALFDSCRLYDLNTTDRKEIIRRIARQKIVASKACLDDVAAIESGMELENRSIDFFLERLKGASGVEERELLNHLIAEERAHYIMLADLKFYYIDPEHWFMEKGKTELDGAGASS